MKNHTDDKTIEKDDGDCGLSELSGIPSLPAQMDEPESIQGKAEPEKKLPFRPLYLIHPLSTNKYPGKAAAGKKSGSLAAKERADRLNWYFDMCMWVAVACLFAVVVDMYREVYK